MAYIRKPRRSNNWVYRRRVPVDVQEAFGQDMVEEGLRTPDRREAERRGAILTAELEQRWDVLRGAGTSLQRWEQGVEWLSEQEPLDLSTNNDWAVSTVAMDALEAGQDVQPVNGGGKLVQRAA